MEIVKVTKTATRDFVKKQLGTNSKWALSALLKIYEFQTSEEQNEEHTKDINGIGFTGVDGEIMTSFAKQFIRRKSLSGKQMAIVFKKMPKYWNQIVMISNPASLSNLVSQSLN